MTTGIWGAGNEGQAAARALHKTGQPTLLLVDESDRGRPTILEPNDRFITGPDSLNRLLACDTVIVSPGIPRTHPFREQLRKAGVDITSLTDRWLRVNSGTTIGVTGTKGKSTTATLTGLLLQAAGIETQTGGNIGTPLTDLQPGIPVTVAELSSYQCASITIAPHIAVITSLYEDHLTWHGSKEAYWTDKARIAGPGCETLICDKATLEKLRTITNSLPETITPNPAMQERIQPGKLPTVLQLGQNHNNLQLAILAVDKQLGRPLTEAEILTASNMFQPLPHRLEHVTTRDDVTWVDDTLSTVPESVIAAAEAHPGNIILIMGGEDRGIHYDSLTEYLNGRTPKAHLITIPGNGPRIATDYEQSHQKHVHHTPDLTAATQLAAQLATPHTTIILSPGAPSYDNYDNYEAKSAAFRAAIKALGKTGSAT